MSNGARAGQGAVGRLLLLLLLALGLMHLLAHAGSADTAPEQGTVAHAHAVRPEATAQDEGAAAPPLATASDEHSHHGGTLDAAEFGLCAAVIGCCAFLALGGRRLLGRRVALFVQLRQRIQAAWYSLNRPPRPRRSPSVNIAQLAVLRI